MSTSCSWEGKGRYGSFRLRTKRRCAGKTVISLENTCHTWALLWWWFTTKRRYIKCMDLYLYLNDLTLAVSMSQDLQHRLVTIQFSICNWMILYKHVPKRRNKQCLGDEWTAEWARTWCAYSDFSQPRSQINSTTYTHSSVGQRSTNVVYVAS